jgi:hypothetical protein
MRPVRLALMAAGVALLQIAAVGGIAATAAGTVSDGALNAVTNAADGGPRTLDDLLAPAGAPQLENVGIWKAAPTMVCHTSAYRMGEFLNQGCIYDDQGAQLVPTNWPEHAITPAYTYPKDPAYRANAADIVEVRVKPLTDATAFRITFNTMTDPTLVGTTIALGGKDATTYAAPHGANTTMPAEKFVTVHGTSGDIVDAATGQTSPVAPNVQVDLERRQVTVEVPHTAFDPGASTTRIAAAAGLWDNANDRFLVPQLVADATHPGGAVPTDLTPSAYFDVAFRYGEPFDSPWRNDDQKVALAAGDISRFHADVDFAKLAAHVNDDMNDTPTGVPTSGYIERIYPTHFESRQGRRLVTDRGGPTVGSFTQQNGPVDGLDGSRVSTQFGWVCRDECVPDLPGRLQRYLAYVPKIAAPAEGYASMVWTPGFAQTPNDQVYDPGMFEAFPTKDKDLFHRFGERPDAPTVVIAVDGRGNDEWFYGQSGASVIEALGDARRAFDLDPTRTVMSGFSSGAYGANKLSLQFPDLFSKAFICDGLNKAPSIPALNGLFDVTPTDTGTQHEPGSTLTPLLPSRRDQSVVEWAGLPDSYIPYDIPRERAEAYIAGDYDFQLTTFAGLSSEHVVLCANGTWDVATKRLGDMRGTQNPFHVTYVRNPAMDDPASGLVGDHAYWVTRIETRSSVATDLGTIDVVSKGFGRTEAPTQPVVLGDGVEPGTTVPLNPYTTETRTPLAPLATPASNRLVIKAENISEISIDPRRAKVSCSAAMDVTTDGPLTVHLLGCGDRTFGA